MPSGSAANLDCRTSGCRKLDGLGASAGRETNSEQPSKHNIRNAAQRLAWNAVLIALLIMCDATVVSADGSLEYAVKATFLYKFAPFVEWPDSAFASPTSTFNLCLIGDDPFGGLVDQATVGQRIADRSIVVRHLSTVDGSSGCHIMFVAGSKAQSVAQMLDAVRGSSVLTVTDSATKVQAHGIIQFIIQNNRVRFDIDDNAAAQNHLTISSKLLDIARLVQPRRAGGGP